MHNRQGLSVLHILKILKDWRMWPLYFLGLTHMSKSRSSWTECIH